MKTETIIIFILLLLLIISIYGFITSSSIKPADPPNWESKYTVYKITKEKGNYLVWYQSENKTGKYFIGNSKINLDNYLNKSIKIVGNFPKTYSDNESTTQCIIDKCHAIFRSILFFDSKVVTPTIDIDRIVVDSNP